MRSPHPLHLEVPGDLAEAVATYLADHPMVGVQSLGAALHAKLREQREQDARIAQVLHDLERHREEAERRIRSLLSGYPDRRKLKVYGWASAGERVVCAADSKAEVARLVGASSPSRLWQLAETGNAHERLAALERPRTPLTAPDSGHAHAKVWRPLGPFRP